MKIWERLSFYIAILPLAGMAIAYAVHEAMGCGYECTGHISGPIDSVALGAMYLFGYGSPFECRLEVGLRQ